MTTSIYLHQLTESPELPADLLVLSNRGDSWKISTSEALECISSNVWSYLANWSLRTNKPVLQLLEPLAIKWDETPCHFRTNWRDRITLEGTLPCGLYGCICSDGSAHT